MGPPPFPPPPQIQVSMYDKVCICQEGVLGQGAVGVGDLSSGYDFFPPASPLSLFHVLVCEIHSWPVL